MATIIVFGSSLFLASVMVSIKALELKRGRKNILLKLINQFDSNIIKLVASFKFKSLQLIQSVRYIVLVKTKEFAENLFVKTQTKVMDEYRKKQKAILVGEKNIVSKGSVSFYLKKITEDKSNGEKGKIE